MIARSELQQLNPVQRANLIYTSAKAELTDRLWRAALGQGDGVETQSSAPAHQLMDLEGLINALTEKRPAAASPPTAAPASAPVDLLPPSFRAHAADAAFQSRALGPNAAHADAIVAAGARTAIPAAALAAIVDAESAKRPDGSWNTHSRNPRSSAAGLGQFLSGTWVGEAERRGTWLNQVAAAKGWLGDGGRISAGAKSALLALRYDPEASIHATADYARRNLDRLQQAGVKLNDDVKEIARAAYLGHHLGPGDAVKFLGRGLQPGRAAQLLAAQIGGGEAQRRIASAGEAVGAHREWLLGFVDKRIRPDRFLA